jgi:hypothetical protein
LGWLFLDMLNRLVIVSTGKNPTSSSTALVSFHFRPCYIYFRVSLIPLYDNSWGLL